MTLRDPDALAGERRSDAQAELAPAGTLRIALVEAPSAGIFFAERTSDGTARGVTPALAAELGRVSGLEMTCRLFPNSGEATNALCSGEADVGFMPVDEMRRSLVAFGPSYYRLESTYLVTGKSGIDVLAEVDRPGIRVVGIANTTTIRAASRSLTRTQPTPVESVAEALASVRDGRADALALSRDSLQPMLALLPGSRLLDGGFQQTTISVAVPRGRPAALAFVTEWLEAAKAEGVVRRIFDDLGFAQEAVAP